MPMVRSGDYEEAEQRQLTEGAHGRKFAEVLNVAAAALNEASAPADIQEIVAVAEDALEPGTPGSGDRLAEFRALVAEAEAKLAAVEKQAAAKKAVPPAAVPGA
jgi:hypothetical protein